MSHDVASLYAPWEQDRLESWEQFQRQVNRLAALYPHHRLVWRGVRHSGWSIHSSLFRLLHGALKRLPTEADMVSAEKSILERARTDWRFDGKPALETFAQLQHVGGPTRLLDVSENPMVALWFAVERLTAAEEEDKRVDGRLFAFVTPQRDIRLNENWHTRRARWHSLADDAARAKVKWGTGTGRRFWRPPVYHSRIAAQSAGFLLDGVPIDGPSSRHGLVAPSQRQRWDAETMRQVSSIPLQFSTPREGDLPADAAPVFTFRVAVEARDDMRRQLETRFGYRASSIYPDIEGLVRDLVRYPEDLLS